MDNGEHQTPREIRQEKRAKNLCGWPQCKEKAGKRLMGRYYIYCDFHRKYFRDTQRQRVKRR